jgi:hypothetical protein
MLPLIFIPAQGILLNLDSTTIVIFNFLQRNHRINQAGMEEHSGVLKAWLRGYLLPARGSRRQFDQKSARQHQTKLI